MTYLLLLYKCFLNCFYIIIYLIRITNDLKQNIWYWRPIMYINDIRKFFICMSFSMLCCRKNTTISNTQIDLFIYSTHHAYLYIIVYIFKLLLPCQSSLSFISMHFAVRWSKIQTWCTCVSVFTCQNAKERKLVNNLLF